MHIVDANTEKPVVEHSYPAKLARAIVKAHNDSVEAFDREVSDILGGNPPFGEYDNEGNLSS